MLATCVPEAASGVTLVQASQAGAIGRNTTTKRSRATRQGTGSAGEVAAHKGAEQMRNWRAAHLRFLRSKRSRKVADGALCAVQAPTECENVLHTAAFTQHALETADLTNACYPSLNGKAELSLG